MGQKLRILVSTPYVFSPVNSNPPMCFLRSLDPGRISGPRTGRPLGDKCYQRQLYAFMVNAVPFAPTAVVFLPDYNYMVIKDSSSLPASLTCHACCKISVWLWNVFNGGQKLTVSEENIVFCELWRLQIVHQKCQKLSELFRFKYFSIKNDSRSIYFAKIIVL